MNSVQIIGNITKDPDLKYTQSGKAIASFSVAVNKVWYVEKEKKEKVSYIECAAWGKLGENIAKFFKKGNKIGIEGELDQQRWDDKDGNKRQKLYVVVSKFHFCNSGSGKATEETVCNEVPTSEGNPFSDDDIPF